MQVLWNQSCDKLNRKSVPISENELVDLYKLLPCWQIQCFENARAVRKLFSFASFKSASLFVKKLTKIQDEQNHHAKVIVDRKNVEVIWWTHMFNNLHKNDFIMAAKTDHLYLHEHSEETN